MRHAIELKLIVFGVFISSQSIAQVQFSTKSTLYDTLSISVFDKPVRFTKPINKITTLTGQIPKKDSVVRVSQSVKPVDESALSPSIERTNLADGLQHIPSILPVRITKREQYRVSSWFGLRCHPVTGRQQAHNGMDFPQPAGTRVYATADGYITQVGIQSGGLGLAIQIKHHSGFSTTYGHLSRSDVRPGQWVRRGQRIGRVGQTGLTTGPHLHYIVWYRGRAVDPKRYCFLALGLSRKLRIRQ